MKSDTKSLADMISTVDEELESAFETKLRAALETQDRPRLVETLLQLVVRDRTLQATPRALSRQPRHVESLAERRQRLDRIRELGLNDDRLREILDRYRSLDRERLVAEGYLVDPSHKGNEALGPQHRTRQGESLLNTDHDLFYALLFCDRNPDVPSPWSIPEWLLCLAQARAIEATPR